MTRGQDAVALAEALRHLAKALTPTTATITTSATVVAVTLGPPALATDNGAAGASPLVLVASASPSEPVERTAPVTSATEPTSQQLHYSSDVGIIMPTIALFFQT